MSGERYCIFLSVQYGRLKCEFILNLDESLVTFLTVFNIFYDESVNSTFRNLKKKQTKMADQKLNLNINSSEIRYLRDSDITNYKLEFIT